MISAKQLPELPESSQSIYQQRVNGSYLTQSPARRQREDSGPPFEDYLNPSNDHPIYHPLPLPMYTPQRSNSPLPASITSAESTDLFGSSGKRGFWRKLSTPPSATNSPSPDTRPTFKRSMSSTPGTPTPYNDGDNRTRLDSSSGLPASPGLGRNRSTGQLLAEFGRGLSRVGSVIKRSSSRDDLLPSSPLKSTPTRQGSKLGLSKQGSVRRQVHQGSWRGRKLEEGLNGLPVVGEEIGIRDMEWQEIRADTFVVDAGDEGITRPFNVAHDLHISPDLDNLPAEWVVQLKAQGMTEAELLTISAARKRQASATTKPLQIRHNSGRRRHASSRRKDPTTGIPRTESSSNESPSPNDPLTSPVAKSRLPALTHLDDRRPSVESSHLIGSSAGHSRAPSFTPSLTSKAPPSSFSPPSRSASSKRLSDQLRGFASINLDGVGSWADDVIGLVGEAGTGQRNGGIEGEGKVNHARTGSVNSTKEERRLSRSSDSHKSPRRVPVPDVYGPRKSTESTSSQSHTSASGSTARRPPYSPSTSDKTDHGLGEVPAPSVCTPTTPMPNSQEFRLDKSYISHITPLNSLTMSHTPSQSLSTTEDQEIRTPSTSEYGDVKLSLVSSHPGVNHRWRSTESMGWIAPEEAALEKVGKLGGRLDLFDSSAKSSPTTPSFERQVCPLTPRQDSTPTSIPSATSRTNERSTPSHLPSISDEEEYDLSIPSPLRPPPRPHFSLPASAASDSDDAYDPLGVPEPSSPILRSSDLRMGDAKRYDPCGSDSKRSSRKPSDGSILIIHQYSESHAGEGSRKNSGISNFSLPGSRQGSDVSGAGSGSRKGSDVSGFHKRQSVLIDVREKEGEEDKPIEGVRIPLLDTNNSDEEDKGDHLSPLPISLNASSLSSASTHTSLPYLNFTQTLPDKVSNPVDRQSMAESIVSADESDSHRDSTFRDSVAGARIMVAQMGGHEIGRMSLFNIDPEDGGRDEVRLKSGL